MGLQSNGGFSVSFESLKKNHNFRLTQKRFMLALLKDIFSKIIPYYHKKISIFLHSTFYFACYEVFFISNNLFVCKDGNQWNI